MKSISHFYRGTAEGSIDEHLNRRSVLEVVDVEIDSLVCLLVSCDFHV